jgi:hypothetical protein
MRKLFSRIVLILPVLLITVFISSPGFSQKKSKKVPADGSVKLVYNYMPDQPITYMNVSKITQDMDINGQSMLVNVSSCLGVVVKSTGREAENLKLEIKIDTLGQSVESPQGSAGGTVDEVKDKVFNMIISPTGKSIDITEAEKLTYSVEGSGESNMGQEFISYFPELPVNPVKAGDTWTTNDTISSKSQSMSVWVQVESVNKFEEIKNIDGSDCAVVSATLSGTRKMTTQTQGMTIDVTGTFTGTAVFFFAIKEGYFIKQSVTSKLTGTIEITDQNMSFPLVMDILSTNEIVK